MHTIQDWLSSVPPTVMYLLLALVVMVESMGVPLPGEIALVSAALLASSGYAEIGWVCAAASLGAIIGDSTGYLIGHRGGRPFLERLGRRFPKHLGPPHLARAERILHRWGSAAIFFGRFVALLRVLAGPLAGALRMPYRRFLVANVAGGVVWATGTALIIFFVGKAAEAWLSRFSWVALVVAVIGGIVSTMIIRHRAARAAAQEAAAEQGEDGAESENSGAESAVAAATAANPLPDADKAPSDTPPSANGHAADRTDDGRATNRADDGRATGRTDDGRAAAGTEDDHAASERAARDADGSG